MNRFLLNTLLSVVVFSMSSTVRAELKPAKHAVHKKSPTSSASSASSISQSTLWDAWYTVTVNDKIPYAYYNEKAEVTEGRAHIQLRVWKKEEGFINEENFGEFAKTDSDLTPLFYNYRITYKTSETLIDGTIDENRLLTTKVRKNAQDVPTASKQLPKNAILSYMFPIWLAQRAPTLKQDQSLSFYALSEDALDTGFPVTTGSITLMKADEVATKTKTKRIKVNFMDADSFWWVGPKGNAIAIDTPQRKVLVQLVSKEKALGFLK